jgi:hypothetical protein
MLGTLAIVCALQDELDLFPSKATTALLQLDNLHASLSRMAETCDLTRILRPMARAMVRTATLNQLHLDFLRAVLQDVALAFVAPTTAKTLFHALLNGEGEDLADAQIALLSIVHQRLPDVYEAAARETAGANEERLRKIMNAVVSVRLGIRSDGTSSPADDSQADIDEDTAIAVGIGGDSATLRILGLRKLLADPTADPGFLHDTLVARLRDLDLDVAHALFEGDALLMHLEPQVVLDVSREIIANPSAPRALVAAHAGFLAGAFAQRHPALADDIALRVLWPRLLFAKSARKTTAAVWIALDGSELDKAGPLAGCAALADETGGIMNGRVVERMALNLAGEVDALPVLVEHLAAMGPTAHLATLILIRLASSSASLPIDTLTSILRHLQTTTLTDLVDTDAAALTTGDVLSADLLDSVYAKATSARTALRLRAALTLAAVRALPSFAEVSWATPGAGEQQRDPAILAYSLAHGVKSPVLAGALLKPVFASLGNGIVGFLVVLASDATQPPALRAIALRETAHAVSTLGKHVDVLDWLPTLVACLMDAEKPIRSASMGVVGAIRVTAQESDAVPAAGGPKYTASKPAYSSLAAADAKVYLDALVARQGDIVLDRDGLIAVHASLEGHTKRAIFEWYALHAIAHPDPLFHLPILEALRGMAVSRRLVNTLPLFRDVNGMEAQTAERYVELLFEGYEKPGKALDSHAEGGAYDIIKSMLATEGAHRRLYLVVDVADRRTGLLQRRTLRVVGDSVFAVLKPERRLDLLQTLVVSATVKSSVRSHLLAFLRRVTPRADRTSHLPALRHPRH